MTEVGTNGYVKWRDLEDRDRRLTEAMDKRLERAHNYANERLDQIDADIVAVGAKVELTAEREVTKVHNVLGKMDDRVDKVESVLDQQRGARNLVYGLIGSNLLLVVVSLFTIAHLAGAI
jgi:hypothetical protein